MNDFSELEADLRKLRPAPVSEKLIARIESALAETPAAGLLPRPAKGDSFWWSLGMGLAAIAAVLVIGLTFFGRTSPRQPAVAKQSPTPVNSSVDGFQPSGITQVVYHQRDEGLIFSPNESQRPLRRLRYETSETMQWRNPRTGASLRVSYPAEQVVLTPVSFQ